MLPSNTSAARPNGLVQSRVSVDGQGDVFSVTAHLDSQANLTQQLAAVGADNRAADNTVGLFVEDQFGHTICAVRSDSTAEAAHGKVAVS